MDAQEYFYKHKGKTIKLNMNPGLITIKFNKNYSVDERNALLHNHRIIALQEREKVVSNLGYFTLKKNLSIKEVEQLIDSLNTIPEVDFAAPVFNCKNGSYMSLSTELLVQLNSINDITMLEKMVTKHGIIIKKHLGEPAKDGSSRNYFNGLYLLEVPKSKINQLLTITNTFQSSGLFSYAQPNFIRYLKRSFVPPTDPMYGSEWAIQKMKVPSTWVTTTGSSAIKVAIIDLGVDGSHPDLATNTLIGFDATYNSGSASGQTISDSQGYPEGDDYHGTACAGEVAAIANNGIGLAGVAYGCKILPIRVAIGGTDGTMITDEVIMASAINWAWSNGFADVLSNSWGGGSVSTVVETAIDKATVQGRGGLGCPVLFSTGNSDTAVSWPASYPTTIAVGATNEKDHRCDVTDWGYDADGESQGSNYGTGVDVAAPGNNIVTTDIHGVAGDTIGDYTHSFGGTSAACPYAAGVAALILSANPNMTMTQVRFALEVNCEKVGGYSYASNVSGQPTSTWSNELGYGRINAQNAVAYAESLLAPMPPYGTVSATASVPSPLCWGSNPYPQILVTINGNPPLNDSYFGQCFQFEWYYDAACTNPATELDPSPYKAKINIPTGINIISPPSSYPYTTTYYLAVWDGNNTKHTNVTSITITLHERPIVATTNNFFICRGSNQNLSTGSSVTHGIAPYTYQWNPPATNLTNPSSLNCTAQNVQGFSDFVLTVVDQAGCSATNYVNLEVSHIVPTSTITPHYKICVGSNPITITQAFIGGFPVYAGYQYSWLPSTNLSSSTASSPIFTPVNLGITTYTVTATDQYGCTGVGYVIVDVSNNNPVATTSGPITTCPLKPTTLVGTGSGGTLPYTFSWKNGSTNLTGTSSVNQMSVTIPAPSSTSTYNFKVTDSYGCIGNASTTITISMANVPVASINTAANLNHLCQGNSYTLNATASGGSGNYTYSWSSSGNSFSPPQTATTTFKPNNAPYYASTPAPTYIYLNVLDNNGCSTVQTVTATVYQYLNVLGGLPVRCANDAGVPLAINITDNTGPYTYTWSPASSLNNIHLANPIATPSVGTSYSVYVIDAYGCTNGPPRLNDIVDVYTGPPQVDFTANSCQPNLQLFNQTNLNCSQGQFYPNSSPTVLWTMGSGLSPSSSTAWNPVAYIGVPPGSKNISLTVTTYNSLGTSCYSGTKAKSVYVIPPTSATSTINVLCTTYSGSIIYNDQIANKITTNSLCQTNIANGATATYIAGTGGISILPGFDAAYGSNFLAYIDATCFNLPKANPGGNSTTNTDTVQTTNIGKTNINGINQLKIYPNPNNGTFILQFITEPNAQIADVIIYNILGDVIWKNSEGVRDSELKVNLASQQPGIYYVRALIENSLFVTKFVIQ
ncbi:MAG: S8 family serine peptidase [Bacteroidia bacterium]